MRGAVGEQGGHRRASGGAGVWSTVTQGGALAVQRCQHRDPRGPSSSMVLL